MARISNSGYQTGTTAAPQNARKVLARVPTIQNPSGVQGGRGNAKLPTIPPIHNRYGSESTGSGGSSSQSF